MHLPLMLCFLCHYCTEANITGSGHQGWIRWPCSSEMRTSVGHEITSASAFKYVFRLVECGFTSEGFCWQFWGKLWAISFLTHLTVLALAQAEAECNIAGVLWKRKKEGIEKSTEILRWKQMGSACLSHHLFCSLLSTIHLTLHRVAPHMHPPSHNYGRWELHYIAHHFCSALQVSKVAFAESGLFAHRCAGMS